MATVVGYSTLNTLQLTISIYCTHKIGISRDVKRRWIFQISNYMFQFRIVTFNIQFKLAQGT